MARIRTIKPDFCHSETLSTVSRDARLCFVQLWTFVDDEGRCRAAKRILAGALFPFDEDALDLIDGWLGELEAIDCVFRYQVGGTTYLQVRNWKRHQKIDRPSGSRLPAPPDFDAPSMNPIEGSMQPRLPLDAGPRTLDLGPSTPDLACASADAGGEGSLVKHFFDAYPIHAAEDGVARELKRIVASGVGPEEIFAGARRYAAEVVGKAKDKIANPVGWLKDGRWKDGTHKPALTPAVVSVNRTLVRRTDPRWNVLAERWRQERGRYPPEAQAGGWSFPNEWIADLNANERGAA